MINRIQYPVSTSTTLLKIKSGDLWWAYQFAQSDRAVVVVDEFQLEPNEKIAAIVAWFDYLIASGDVRQRKWYERQSNGEGILFIALPCFFQNRHVAASHP